MSSRWDRQEDIIVALLDASPVDLAREVIARDLGMKPSEGMRVVPDARLLNACVNRVKVEDVVEAERAIAARLGCDLAHVPYAHRFARHAGGPPSRR